MTITETNQQMRLDAGALPSSGPAGSGRDARPNAHVAGPEDGRTPVVQPVVVGKSGCSSTGGILHAESDLAKQLAGSLSPGAVVRSREPLARRTTLRVGGPADVYVEPASEEDLAAVLRFCGLQQKAFFVLGRGSNLLVKDGGFRGIVISLVQASFSRIEVSGQSLRCGAGARLKAVAIEAKRRSLSGFEFLEGIPGSVGGGLRMNAGAMGGAIFDVAESVWVMDYAGQVHERSARALKAEYRCCAALKSAIALAVVLRGEPGAREQIEQRMNQYSRKRWDTQPAAPSAGCIFKNPRLLPAGQLIEELGLKGARVGGAHVSVEHGNFIINDGAATAKDVLDLIEIIRHRARAERSLELETEVEIIGE
jgi:UDP-N-acetylenolpyruvoylglucosamine reductase